MVKNFKQEIPFEKLKMNNYKYYYINRLSGRIGYITNEDSMIPVLEDKKIKNDIENIWI